MQVKNFTSLANFRYVNEDSAGRSFNILILKATFGFDAEWTPVLVREQEPLWFTDIYHGNSETSSLRYPSDIVPFKPKTDVILNATSFAPKGEIAHDWTASLAITGRGGVSYLNKLLRVKSPTQWNPTLLGWTITEPQSAACVSVRYENAFGGRQNIERDTDLPPNVVVLETNPVGKGWVHDKKILPNESIDAPQLFAANSTLPKEPFRPIDPVGFGAIPPSWLPRRPLGGTYDQNWIDNIWPRWAPDYDFAYHNSAPYDQQLKQYLRGDETVQLHNLVQGRENQTIPLPNWTPFLHIIDATQNVSYIRPNLDTIILDIESGNPEQSFMYLAWRYVFLEDTIFQINIDLDCPNKPGLNSQYNLELHQAPHPADLFKEGIAS